MQGWIVEWFKDVTPTFIVDLFVNEAFHWENEPFNAVFSFSQHIKNSSCLDFSKLLLRPSLVNEIADEIETGTVQSVLQI